MRTTEKGLFEEVDHVNKVMAEKFSKTRLRFGHRYNYFAIDEVEGDIVRQTLITGTKNELSLYLSGIFKGISLIRG